MSVIVRTEVTETAFGFYTDEDIKNLSVKRIISHVSQDLLGNNLDGGLYDPSLGPTEAPNACVTCAKTYVHCPGHIGHIELDVPTGLEALQEEASENTFEDIADDDSDNENTDEEMDMVADDDVRVGGSRAITKVIVSENDKYLVPWETEAQLKLLWRFNSPILDFIWGRALMGTMGGKLPRLKTGDINDPNVNDGWKMFFSRVVIVPPNRFRPASKMGDATSEHPQNIHLSRVLEGNEKIRRIQIESSVALSNALDGDGNDTAKDDPVVPAGANLSKLVSAWIDLQNSVNCYVDSDKDPNPLGSNGAPSGIRQILERKEGLFRKHMMGKRVNYCCRSVISPDPYLGTNEVGIPVQFAKVLHYPTPVNDFNIRYLRTLVERGPDQYPGANQIETADGKITKLEKLSAHERAGRARLLGTQPGSKVYRHLINGDVLLVNRQPTLHKPGIMAHKARVLTHVKEQTIRMNYANCNSYNADFDGDEMNCHFVQNDIARAEATYIMNTDNQYIVPTSGNPLRGLIQDHVASGVKMTCKDTFLTKMEFQQLLYVAVCGLPGTEIVTAMELMVTPPPTIYKPKMLWTGKQVVSGLLQHMCRPPLPQLNLDGKTRTPPTAFGAEHNEHIVVFRFGELLCGVIDKASIGNASLGIIHAVYELYGSELAGRLLTVFGRLFTYFLQDAGHTCGIADLTLTSSAEAQRKKLLEKVKTDAQYGLDAFLSNTSVIEAVQAGKVPFTEEQNVSCEERSRHLLMTSVDKGQARVRLDAAMQAVINTSASDVIKVCIPDGLAQPFLKNNFSMMVLTGAKGSAVNQSQISCFLGQQALEGQRVPTMISGKSLPSFRAYDSSARSGGFVQDRFLTGVKPQEYYFHCMAGREGLVDTAVKTSRSGYLQRCLVKHLEELKVNYDMTVRDSSGAVVQFLFGEDGLDPTMASLLGGKPNQMQFLARNHQAVSHKYSMHEGLFTHGVNYELAVEHHDRMKQAKKMMAKGILGLKKGGVIMARRKWRAGSAWSRGNVKQMWVPAEILKVRTADTPEKETYDLLYFDGVMEKKVPKGIYTQPLRSTTEGGSDGLRCDHPIFVPLIKVGLFDTAMNSLALGSCIGACSEKLQDSIQSYIKANPDGAVSEQMTESTVTPMALELLVWMKYMRSLACPGEAVGCVAAQSVGEPSTQMTLNTFHLAGHGGANVTLGIPRLREVIMTASKSLKTPTMLVPLVAGQTMMAAKELARSLGRLPLSSLLNHKGGVEVGESIVHAADGQWKRVYRIRLLFEDLVKIKQTFGVDFDTIKKVCTEGLFHTKLVYLIQLEQRRSGEKASSNKNQIIGSWKNTKKVAGEAEFNENDEGQNEVKGRKDSENKHLDKLLEDEEEEEEEDENEEEGVKKVGSAKEIDGYEEASDDEQEMDAIHSELLGNGTENIGSDSDSDAEGNGEKKKGEKEVDSDDDSDIDDAPAKQSSKSSKAPPVMKTPAKKSSRVSFGTGQQSTLGIPHHTTAGMKKSLSLGGEVGYDESEGWIEMLLSYPATTRRLLMVQLVEKAAANSTIRATKDIKNAYGVPCEINGVEGFAVQTEGVNFEAVWALPSKLIQANEIKCNDIWRMLTTFGVESARASIVSEVQGVFAVYGIDVNARHLSLIADFMTRTGSYLPMSRMGMNECASPYLQMSFETTSTFLVKAASEGAVDSQESPSARIVTGSVAKVGTGCFDIMLPLMAAN